MGKHFKLTFKTKPYIVKYLQFVYGNPISLDISDYTGFVISSLLEKNVYPDRNKKCIQSGIHKLTTDCTIQLPPSWLNHYRYGVDLSEKKTIYLNRLLELEFKQKLVLFVQIKLIKEPRYKGYEKALMDFCDMYKINVPEDITFEAIKQMEYRYRPVVVNNFQKFIQPQFVQGELSF